jgi:hypothetical protein
MIDINKLKLTDMNDFRLIPQLVEEMNTKFIKEEEKIISEKLFNLNIDKDILINQVQEINRLNDILREYEELEEKGLLLKLPCKVGTTVYAIATIYECKHDYLDCPMDFPDVYQCERNCKCEYEYKKLVVRPIIFKFEMLKDFNKKVFLTKEEAEQELKRLECAE